MRQSVSRANAIFGIACGYPDANDAEEVGAVSGASCVTAVQSNNDCGNVGPRYCAGMRANIGRIACHVKSVIVPWGTKPFFD